MRAHSQLTAGMMLTITATVLVGCSWQGLNSLPLPGTQGVGPGAFTIQAQLPEVNNIQPNTRVRMGDVNIGTVTRIERQGWHALLTLKLNGDVQLPSNSTVSVGQTSLLGSQHIELAPPLAAEPAGVLHQGSLIPLSDGSDYPTTERTLAAASLLLNGGGVGQLQDITAALSTAFGEGRDEDLRSLFSQLDLFTANLNSQTDEIIAAGDSLNRLLKQFAEQKPIVDKALETIPTALEVFNRQRENLIEAVDQLGKFSALAAESVNQTKEAFIQELNDLAPVLQSLADAGPALTRSLGLFTTFPFPKDNVAKWFRGDHANISVIADLTLSRLDSSLLTGTRFEGELTELEMQWGRTIGQLPSPYTSINPLVTPYNLDQGP